jgi:hypothetical protein
MQGPSARGQVELCVQPGQRRGVTDQERDIAQAARLGQVPALFEHLRGQIERADVSHPGRQRPAQVRRAGRHVEHLVAGRRGQFRHDPVQPAGGEPGVGEARSLDPELLTYRLVVVHRVSRLRA